MPLVEGYGSVAPSVWVLDNDSTLESSTVWEGDEARRAPSVVPVSAKAPLRGSSPREPFAAFLEVEAGGRAELHEAHGVAEGQSSQ